MRMFWMRLALAIVCLPPASAISGESRVDEILERFGQANRWRDHVMIVAHRAGGLREGKALYPENSLAALEASIADGAEMVEVDVRRSADGAFVVMHDSWLDRTTTCKGEVAPRALAQLRECNLIVEATGEVTNEVVPTLAEFLSAARGRILVNIDNKLDRNEFPAMAAVARDLGMARQVVIKENLWNAQRLSGAQEMMRRTGDDIHFMPIIADDAVREVEFAETVQVALASHAMELINWRAGSDLLTANGGPLFSSRMRALAVRGDWHIWANTYAIVNKPGGFLSGGRGDELATLASLPAESWGFWAERGATIIQTDEPGAAIEWLAANGYRVPYEADAVELAGHAANIN